MAPPPWATPEQKIFLLANCDSFIEAQKNRTVYKFWVALNRDWLEQWPEPGTENLNHPDTEDEKVELGKKIDGRKNKIRHWYNNRSNKARKVKPVVLQVNPKTRRRPQLMEFYSHKVYESKVKAKVDKEMEEKSLKPTRRLAVARRIAQEAYNNEPEDVKGAILAEFEAAKDVVLAESGKSGTESTMAVKSMAEMIESLPTILDQIFDELGSRAGWTFSVVAGGPNPINGGRIGTFG